MHAARPSTLWWAASLFTLASGFSALVYEVLWLKELGLLFGNTAHASSVGLGIFFAGLAAGGWFWGTRAAGLRRPLIAYAWLEVGIALAALPFFWLMEAYRGIYAAVYSAAGSSEPLFLLIRIALSLAVFFPPAFFMGGTMPVLAQAAVSGASLGRRGPILYALNTAGAAAGALAAGFYLPAALGFRQACLVAVGINLAIAAAAFVMAARTASSSLVPASALASKRVVEPVRSVPRVLWALAALSGFLTLGLEVAAARLFAQVLQNSVYTFSTVLVVFLLSLSAGSVIASRLARLKQRDPWTVLAGVFVLAGIGVALVPFVFHDVTSGLQYLAPREGWAGYVTSVFGMAFLVLGIPCVVAGIAFPYLLRLAEGESAGVGAIIGRLGAWNTIGAIVGSVATGFVLLPALGLWRTFTLLAAAYLVAAALVLARGAVGRPARVAIPLAALVALLTVVSPARLPLLRLDRGEVVLDVRESVYGVTAVVQRGSDRLIKVNNYYSLGGSASLEHERNQSLIPVLTHPNPRTVFFLGMGTGITAGAAVQPFVERLVVAELIPDVVTAARGHFREFANGLFDDPRVEIVVADGRNHLAAVRDRYDLIISDLFVPWEAGTGSLYTREHYQTARTRLTPQGAFVQWLPLYQMSRSEFMTIARTMVEVFPSVVMWRGDFFPERPIVALVGSESLLPLDPDLMAARGRQIAGGDVAADAVRALTLPFYAGNLSATRHLIPAGPLNTDDRPVIEYAAPITQREQRTGAAAWFTSLDLMMFFRDVLQALPPDRDPYLARLDPAEREWIVAGFHYHTAAAYERLGERAAADQHGREFAARLPERFRRPHQDEPEDRVGVWEQR